MNLPSVVYLLCALTSLGCTFLLARAYRKNRVRLIFWSMLCFAGLTASNVVLFYDLVITPTGPDLMPWRTGLALASVSALLYGLIVDPH
jgi:FtsH-binding integral membrane protein